MLQPLSSKAYPRGWVFCLKKGFRIRLLELYIRGGTPMHKGDVYILLLLVVVFIVWFFGLFWRWLQAPSVRKLPVSVDDSIPQNGTVDFLRQKGYEMLAGKQRVPIHITIDDTDELQSRLFIDYI